MRKKIYWMVFLAVILSTSVSAKEVSVSLNDDSGIPTLKDLRLTLPDEFGNVSFFGRNRTRYEAWDYFTSATDNDYEFMANQLRLGVKWIHEIFNVNSVYQYTQLSNLPTTTSAGAGAGSLYFSNSRDRFSHGAFIKYLNVEIKQTRKLLEPLFGDLKFLRGFTETFGRFNYSSGNEMKSGDKKIEWLKSQRIADRLIGGFEWAHYGRSFDGWKVAREDDFSNINVAGFSPTQGGFEESAFRTITDLDVIAVEANFKKDKLIPGMEEQFFYYHYDDHRNIAAATTRFDNTGRTLRAGGQTDIELHTFGGHLVGDYKVGSGVLDVLGWGAYQTGNWFDLEHSAYAYAVETGYQLTDIPWTPWLRGGYNYGSGDQDPGGDAHGTFYQILPAARIYSYSILYNLMNTEDTFASLILKPHHSVTVRTEFHDLKLSENNDRWYLGSGAMHDNIADDFAARSSNGQKDLGKLLDATLIWNINSDVTLMAYYGHFIGDDVVKHFFTKQKRNNFVFAELTVNF